MSRDGTVGGQKPTDFYSKVREIQGQYFLRSFRGTGNWKSPSPSKRPVLIEKSPDHTDIIKIMIHILY